MRATAFAVLLVAAFELGLTSAAFRESPQAFTPKAIIEGIGANFSVEGDLQADLIQFGSYVGIPGTDDWFDLAESELEGIGVIDTTGGGAYRALIQAGGAAANITFERHMAFPENTVQHGKLFLDAVYARDNHSALVALDSTDFMATPAKNIDNPMTWDLGIGSTASKRDIVDAVAHIRRDGATTDDSLWLFVGSSTMASSGDAYNDYEFFRQADTYVPGASHLTGTGPDSGHTAWRVIGGNLQSGDVILSVDFESGGTNPFLKIHIWVDPADTADIKAVSGGVIQFSGIFNGGGDHTGPFGYAELVMPPGVAYARVNGTASDPPPWSTLASPWGSLHVNATFYDSVQALQFAEAGINLSAMGLDQSVTGNSCAGLFGHVLFKTRASQSFTAELRDFVGPYMFGEVREAVVCEAYGDTVYEGETATLTSTASGGIPPYTYCWQKEPYTGPCLSTSSALVINNAQSDDAGTYRLVVDDVCSCSDTCYADLVVYASPDTTPPEVIDDLTILLENGSKSSSGDMRLIWTEPYDSAGVTRYVIYRSTSVATLGDSLAGTTDNTYLDMGAAGDSAANYFYGVKAADAAGNKSEESNRVGEFDTVLSNGTD